MANLKINDLQPLESEFAELSDLELEAIAGGKGGYIGKWGRQIDKFVRRDLGGWTKVIGTAITKLS